MNDHKFAFIICTNRDIFFNECLVYLRQLIVPEGYEVTVLTIDDAGSITSGYNEGRLATDAKYKIYMHQDVFIINKNFLSDILSIFKSDEAIGMIGMVGYPVVSKDGCMWHEERAESFSLYGAEHSYPDADCNSYRYSLEKDNFRDVALIDGLMMITAQDLPWDEELLTDWDFYDAFQSINYLEHGYRVVVPVQTLPWFIHDDGKFLNLWNYEKYNQIFREKYKKYLGKSYTQVRQLAENKPSPDTEGTHEHSTI